MKARRRVLDAHDSTPTIRTNLPWPIADAVIVEAASQVRRLLRVSSPPAAAGVARKYEESRHV